MVSLYFGLPGCGKTTLMTQKAIQAVRSAHYVNVYCNVHISVPGVTYIDNSCIGKFNLVDCCILIDEATLFADNRDYKHFPKHLIEFFLLHRHYNCDVLLFTQQWDGVDKKIRVITDRVYYVYKGPILGKWFTKHYRIPYGIVIPDPHDKSSSEKLGEIVQGYCKPSIFIRMFAKWTFRPNYYQYFDSWQRPVLPDLPDDYIPYYEVHGNHIIDTMDSLQRYKRVILLRSIKNSFTSVPDEFRQIIPSLLSDLERILPRSNHKQGKYSISSKNKTGLP